jgi:hypothetical protein
MIDKAAGEFKATCTLRVTERDRLDPHTGSAQEVIEEFERYFPLVETWTNFLTALDAYIVWRTARSLIDLEFALIAFATKTDCGISRFSFGANFVDSLRLNSAWGESRHARAVFDTCAAIVTDKETATIGPFYRDPAKRIQATKDGGYLGWRAHVTKGGVGLRLMYWRRSTGEVEFSRVGPKNELRID